MCELLCSDATPPARDSRRQSDAARLQVRPGGTERGHAGGRQEGGRGSMGSGFTGSGGGRNRTNKTVRGGHCLE